MTAGSQVWRENLREARKAGSQGDWKACLERARAALEQVPDNPRDMPIWVARALTALGDRAGALAAWTAVTDAPAATAAHFGMAVRGVESFGLRQQASDWAVRAYAIEPSAIYALMAGKCALAAGRSGMAVEYLRKYARFDLQQAFDFQRAAFEKGRRELARHMAIAIDAEYGGVRGGALLDELDRGVAGAA